jgi:hypothetical protein
MAETGRLLPFVPLFLSENSVGFQIHQKKSCGQVGEWGLVYQKRSLPAHRDSTIILWYINFVNLIDLVSVTSMHKIDMSLVSLATLVKNMSECFMCQTALEPVSDAEIEGVELCVDCCEKMDIVIRDYLISSPGGLDLVLDIIADDLDNPEGRLRETLKAVIKEIEE